MNYKRSSGIIFHPTSLPGLDGIGDLGPEAYRWINFLYDAGCELWQVLPLGPTGYGDSPYQCFSAFAGNPYLVSSTLLFEEGLLTRADLADRPVFPEDHVDYGPVIEWKLKILDRAFFNFERSGKKDIQAEFQEFQTQKSNWLSDFALFMAIKEANSGASWNYWPLPLRTRDETALAEFAKSHAIDLKRHAFRQFLFFRQWQALRAYAHEKSIRIIGDIPIFVAYDSADAWGNPDLFFLKPDGAPTVVAGVPPDYYSPTGQLWGNPLYRWEVHQNRNFDWWVSRFQATLEVVDIIRLDHFRGFSGYWEVQAENLTAENGSWVPGPGVKFFEAVSKRLGEIPIIAEDLGVITIDVVALRDKFNFPGMKVLQFGFGTDPDDPFLPHNYPTNCVAYTGTHDNDTSLGWYKSAPETEQDLCRRYLTSSGENISWDMMRAVWMSVSKMTLATFQDLLGLGSEARMNFPGKASGNWSWRCKPDQISVEYASRLHELNYLYGRLHKQAGAPKKKSMHTL